MSYSSKLKSHCMYKMNNADIKEWAKNYEGEPFDAILCDPPYELGFMGKSWDSSGIAFDQEMWADLFRHIKPGGHLLAFSGSRTYHRMAVAIEDAGFQPRDMLVYCYGSGFPKSLNIGKAVDKIQGNEREVAPNPLAKQQTASKPGTIHGQRGANTHITKGTSPYEGYGTALKPAIEPIILARKPISEKNIALNVLKHGTGGLNIDGTRVGTETRINNANGATAGGARIQQLKPGVGGGEVTGRFPANLIHDGSDEVEAVFPSDRKGGGGHKNKYNPYGGNSFNKSNTLADENNGFNDSGSASRFFYTAKASKSERNAGLDGFEEVVRNDGRNTELASGHMPQNRSNTPKANHHPTVKPLSLTKYLATLIKPPTGGRLLVPFSGSGSEMIGALQAGWEYVEGVELTEEYIPIAEARIKYWLSIKEEESNQLELINV